MISLCFFSDLVFLCFFLPTVAVVTVVEVVVMAVSSRMSGVSVKFILELATRVMSESVIICRKVKSGLWFDVDRVWWDG